MYPILKSDHLHKPKFIGKHRITLRRKNSVALWKRLTLGLLILIFLLVGTFILGKDSFFKNFLEKKPIELLLQQCDAHFEQQALEQAKQCYQEVLTLDNQHQVAKTRLAEIQTHHQPNLLRIPNEPDSNESDIKAAFPIINSPVPEQPSQPELPQVTPKPLSNTAPSATPEIHQFSSTVPTNSSQLSAKKLLSQPSQLKKEPEIQEIVVDSVITIDPITVQLQNCQKHFKANRLTSGQPETAFDCYQNVLKQQPHNTQAKAGLKKIEQRYRTWLKRALNQQQLDKADHYLQKLQQVNPNASDLNRLQKQLDLLKTTPPVPRRDAARQEKPQSAKKVAQESTELSKTTSREKNKKVQPAVKKQAQSTVYPPKAETLPVSKTLTLPPNGSDKPTIEKHAEYSKPNIPQKQTVSAQPQPSRCGEIFTQESLGIQPLTNEQKLFKIEYCH